jgi:monoamine oxidase
MDTQGQVRDQQCDVVVVGAGMAGLVAGTTLAPSADVVVLEAAQRPGGRVESVRRGDYWLNIGTQFAEGEGPLFEIMDRHDVARGSLADKKAALLVNGRMVRMDNPAWLILRSRLPLRARIDLARVGLRIKRANKRLTGSTDATDRREYRTFLNAQPATHFLEGVRSREVRELFRAWSGQWIGCEPEETAATQMVFSIGAALEKAAQLPNFSLPVGGNQTLVELLAVELGDRLRLGTEVETLTWDDGGILVAFTDEHGPVRLAAKRAVVAVPADRARAIIPQLPEDQRAAFGDIAYGRYVIVGFFTTETGRQRWDDFYAISTPQECFQMIFNHAAAVRGAGERKPGGALVCHSGGAIADEQFALTDEQIVAAYTRDLLKLFPELQGRIEHTVVRRHERVVPYWGPGARESLPKLRKPVGPVHFAGDYLLGMPSLADAASSGARAAEAVRQSLDADMSAPAAK